MKTLTDSEVDKHLDLVLRAAGSGLQHYTFHRSKEEMRAAMRAFHKDYAGPAMQPGELGKFPLPGQIVEWVQPYGKHSEPVYSRMSYEDIAKTRRKDEPRYTSDQEAVDDFCVVHWAWPVVFPEHLQFPTALRKMWSGTEVQAWIDENWNKA